MKTLLTALTLLILATAPASPGEAVDWDELVERGGVYYNKSSETPFTGEVTGQRERGQFKDGKKEGPWASYWSNGQLRGKGDYKDGKREGSWISYQSNGRLWKEGGYKEGERDGTWIIYQTNDQLWKRTPSGYWR